MTSRRAFVDSFNALLTRRFVDGKNALCWPRALPGDFSEVARLLAPSEGVVVVTAEDLAALTLSAAGRIAADVMCTDLQRLEALGKEPLLNCIAGYPRDDSGAAVVTDVMSFHVDRAPVEVDTFLCTYFGAPSEGLDNDDAVLRVLEPEVRAALLAEWRNSGDDRGDDRGRLREEADAFDSFLAEHSYDLHYRAVDSAQPWSFGVGALWKIAVQWPGARVPPCIHRAPDSTAPRLLLIC
jgi:hypothetical protein